ncbi:glycosyltransferase family 2 protein [Propioniciclava soli]|uniref:glycosyltransferase family 2 protein n=1 Tax=Propioniciclava soli TaxID=2775081 RepID=UPI001E589F20|nr:glycosyltransferase [Propioniciclava soli]
MSNGSRRDASGPDITLAISTIGRDDDLAALLDSVRRGRGDARVEVVLADQSAGRAASERLKAVATPGIDVRYTTSPLGVSRGRNAALALARGRIVAFPDDNITYAPDALATVLALLEARPTLAAVTGRQVTADGRDSMLRWLRHPTPLTRDNWTRTAIASTMFIRRDVLDVVGGFAEDIGTGSGGYVGAGEESDLLLRILQAGGEIAYDPSIRVVQPDPADEPDPSYVRKMRLYGRGQGYLVRRHRLSIPALLALMGRKLLAVPIMLALRRTVRAKSQASFVVGIVEGWRYGGRP